MLLNQVHMTPQCNAITDDTSGSGGPPGERNGQYRHGEWTKGAMAERRKLLLKMLRAGL
jgi:hypothetical protein